MIDEQAEAGAGAARDQAIGLAARLRRRSRWVVLTTLAALVASCAYVVVFPPRYVGVATVLLERQDGDSATPEQAPGGEPDGAAIRIRGDADLARKAIDRLGLAANAEFAGQDAQRIIGAFLSRLTLVQAPGSKVIWIEFVSRDPTLAARGADAAAEIYAETRSAREAEIARSAAEQLARKVEDLEGKVAEAEAKVEALQSDQGPPAAANGEAASAAPISGLDLQLTNARSAEAAATAKADLLRRLSREGRLEEAPASIADDSLRRLVGERAALTAEIADASRTYLPLHPRMKELSAQLARVDARLREAAAKNLRVLDNDAQLAKDQVASLGAALAEQHKTLVSGDADKTRLRALVTEAKDARYELESYQRKYRDAEARDGDGASGARVIAAAEPQGRPASPKPWRTVLLATLAGLAVSSAVAAALPRTESRPDDRRLRVASSPRAVAAAVATETDREGAASPSLAHHDGLAPEEVARRGSIGHSLPAGTLESADALVARLAGCKTSDLIVLVAGNGSGQALAVALETARRLSWQRPALLVDLGATQDWLADILDREDSDRIEFPGLADLLAERASFSEVIRRDLSTSLDVIPSGGIVGRGALDVIIPALASTYPRLVFHASDWRSAPARAAAEVADVVVVVASPARLGQTLEELRDELAAGGAELMGYAAHRSHPAFAEAA